LWTNRNNTCGDLVGILSDLLDAKMYRFNQYLENGMLLNAYLIIKSLCKEYKRDDLEQKLKELEKNPEIGLFRDIYHINYNNFFYMVFDSNHFLTVFPMGRIVERINQITLILEEVQNQIYFAPYNSSKSDKRNSVLDQVNNESKVM